MDSPMRSGVPTFAEYRELQTSLVFAEMEGFSDRFVAAHTPRLRSYAHHWVADPLHQWSRRWEYPFASSHLEALARRSPASPLRFLDAGSGATFFPYWLAAKTPHAEVMCLDSDRSLEAIHAEINRTEPAAVRFTAGDLRTLPFPDRHFHAVYCISVLEHTGDYERVAQEFHRVLAPGGALVVTFDVSRDGRADIPPREAARMLAVLSRVFPAAAEVRPDDWLAGLDRSDLVTTVALASSDPASLPWAKGRFLRRSIAELLHGRLPGPWYKDLTFSCHAFAT